MVHRLAPWAAIVDVANCSMSLVVTVKLGGDDLLLL